MICRIFTLWVMLSALASCADGPPPADIPPESPPAAGRLAQRVVAERLGLNPDEINIAESVAVDFPDASLGCPQPGMAYAQVITPGFRIQAKADGELFDVRVSGSRAIICEDSAKRATPRRTY
jgi:hypothetical protein